MKRQRQPNFTTQEKDVLVSLIGKFKQVIENKQTDGVTTQEKNRAWDSITEQFNAFSPNHVSRNAESLKNFYKNLKKELRKKSANNKKEIYLTGGRPEPPKLSKTDNKILSIISDKTVCGLKNVFDNDALEDAPTMTHQNNFDLSLSEESYEETEKTDWKHHKALDLRLKKPNMALKKMETTVPINVQNIEEMTTTAVTKSGITSPTTPNIGRSLSRRRPQSTVKTLTSSRLGEKYEILADKKIELANCLQKEHEARMLSLELDIKIKQKQLNS